MEKIALSTYEAAAYWWIRCIKFKTRELCISGVRDKDEENFLDTFMHFGDVGYRKLYLDLVDSLKQDKGIVNIGNTVEIKYMDDSDDVEEYQIVGSQEADPFEGKISNESPIASALLNHKVGDVVTVESPNGNYDIEITKIS